LARHRRRAVSGIHAFVLVILQDSDLASSQDCLEGQAYEELSGRGEEGAEGVGGGCDNGVNAEEGAKEEGCG
jgi:hypothetical protein